jgi:Ser/Thr protein kinase RdoA (MazF antagonist)
MDFTGRNQVRHPATALSLRAGAIAYSILSANALRAMVADSYDIDAPVACDLERRGPHDTYVLTTCRDRYIVRVYRSTRSSAEIAWEVDLLIDLAAKGVPVLDPIVARDGRRALPLSAPEGVRHLMLFKYPAGTPMAWTDCEHCRLAGRLLATIHAASDSFVSPQARGVLDPTHLIEMPLVAIRPFLAHRQADLDDLELLAAGLRQRVLAAAGSGLDWGVCHGDFVAKGVHLTTGRATTVIDFSRSTYGWRIGDFVGIRETSSGNRAPWCAFVDGYARVRPLSQLELSMAPLFQAVRQLFDLGLSAQRVDEWGLLRMSDAKIDDALTSLRHWEDEDAIVDRPSADDSAKGKLA